MAAAATATATTTTTATRFVGSEVDYVANRDVRLNKSFLFEPLWTVKGIKNPINKSSEYTSICDIVIDILSSSKSWANAIKKQAYFMQKNNVYLKSRLETSIKDLDTSDTTSMFVIHRNRIDKTIAHMGGSRLQLQRIGDFSNHNRDYILNDGPDMPFNIFHIKLPVYFGTRGSEYIEWISLQDALLEHVFTSSDKAVPNVMGPIHDPIKLIKKIFDQHIIKTVKTSSGTMSIQHILHVMSNRCPLIMSRNTYKDGIRLIIPHTSRQYSNFGKARYTFGLMMHWIQMCHQYLFTDQISHSFRYYFYRNIVFARPSVPIRRIWANLRTLTEDNMPEDPEDPILYTLFEPGLNVYKMRCCGKDISEDAIKGIIQSGRTPCCPMCRGKFIEMDDASCPPDPTIELPAVDDSEYVPYPVLKQELLMEADHYATDPIT